MKVNPLLLFGTLAVIVLIAVSAVAFKGSGGLDFGSSLAIVGVGEKVYAGDTFQHTFTLTNRDTATLPDLDSSDGTVTRLYKAYRIVNPAGTKVDEGNTEITTPLTASATVTQPVSYVVVNSTPSGDYGASAILFKVTQTWSRTTNTWSTGSPVIIDGPQQTGSMAVKYTVETMTPPPTPDVLTLLANLWAGIFNFIKGLFGWA